MTRILDARLATLVVAIGLAACGGSSKNNNGTTADAPMGPQDAPAQQSDAPAQQADAAPDATALTCTSPMQAMLAAQDITYPSDGTTAIWGAPFTTDLGDGGTAILQFEFYGGIEASLTVPLDLTAGNQSNYATCAVCMHGLTIDSTGQNIVRQYFQSGGTITLTQDPITGDTLQGTITGLTLDEVTIDPNNGYTSTPVVGGKCLSVGDVTLAHDAVPNAWTCDHATYNDGTNCDCGCGIYDPDCAIAGAPVNGCTAAQVCAVETCVAKPTNDTCATATALTIGTPLETSSQGETSNYDTGLEAATCTGFSQPGPDVAFKVTLAAGTAYTFALSDVDPNFDPSISIVGPGAATVCTASPIGCLAGSDVGAAGQPESFTYTPTTAGTYFVIVDTFDSTSLGGGFTIEVTQ